MGGGVWFYREIVPYAATPRKGALYFGETHQGKHVKQSRWATLVSVGSIGSSLSIRLPLLSAPL